MKLFVAVLVFGLAAADKLDNTYLPPRNAGTAGGNGNFLAVPSRNYGSASSSGGRGGSAAGSDHNAAAAAIATLRLNNNGNVGDGSYSFDFETQNQIKQQESGEVRNAGTDSETTVVRGSYSFEGPDGVTYTVNYIADENGFQATGDHLPVAPEIPEAIQRSIEQNAREEGNQGSQQGNYQGYSSGRPSAPRPFAPAQQQNRQQASRPSNQYLTPNKPSYNQQTGYSY